MMLEKIILYYRSWKDTRLSSQRAKELSLYPEVPQKPLRQIRRELFYLCRNRMRGGSSTEATITAYFNMGCDRAGEDVRKYVFYTELHTARRKKQPLQAELLRNKMVTNAYLRSCGIPVSPSVVYKTPFVSQEEALEKLRRSEYSHFFAKLCDSLQGIGAFSFSKRGGDFEVNGEIIPDEKLVEMMEGHIVEPLIEQHEDMNKINPGSVASIRLVTVNQNYSIVHILSNMYVGTKGADVSNLHYGGMQLMIDENGRLGEYGLKLQNGRGVYTKHPDTGVVFKGFQIPYWKEAVEVVIKAHQALPAIHSIGWDVAITKSGPVIVEGNERWAPHVFQFYNGPGREYMRQWFDIR